MEKNSKELEIEIASFESKITSYQTELEEKSSVATFFETGATEAKQSIAELEESVRNLESQKKDAEEAFQKKTSAFEKEIEAMKSEMKDMEETMEINEQKRQEAVLEKQRLEEMLNEVGAECDKRGSEQSKNLEKILELEVKLSSAKNEKEDKVQELQDENAFSNWTITIIPVLFISF